MKEVCNIIHPDVKDKVQVSLSAIIVAPGLSQGFLALLPPHSRQIRNFSTSWLTVSACEYIKKRSPPEMS